MFSKHLRVFSPTILPSTFLLAQLLTVRSKGKRLLTLHGTGTLIVKVYYLPSDITSGSSHFTLEKGLGGPSQTSIMRILSGAPSCRTRTHLGAGEVGPRRAPERGVFAGSGGPVMACFGGLNPSRLCTLSV